MIGALGEFLAEVVGISVQDEAVVRRVLYFLVWSGVSSGGGEGLAESAGRGNGLRMGI